MRITHLLLVMIVVLSGCLGFFEKPEEATTSSVSTSTLRRDPTYVEFTSILAAPLTVNTLNIQEFTTSLFTTTTIHPCFDGVKNYDEVEVDCSPSCGDCEILNLTNSYTRYKFSVFWFRFDGTKTVNVTCKGASGWPRTTNYVRYVCHDEAYMLTLRGPGGRLDYRLLVENDTGYADNLMFKILEYDNLTNFTLAVYVKEDPDSVGIPWRASIMSLGGPSCMTNITGFCVRAYAGYEFRLVERASNRAKVEVKFPDGKKYEDVWLTLDEVKTVGEIRVGLLHPYDKGGYAVIYALE